MAAGRPSVGRRRDDRRQPLMIGGYSGSSSGPPQQAVMDHLAAPRSLTPLSRLTGKLTTAMAITSIWSLKTSIWAREGISPGAI